MALIRSNQEQNIAINFDCVIIKHINNTDMSNLMIEVTNLVTPLGWRVVANEKQITFQMDSPAGNTYQFTIDLNNDESVTKMVHKYMRCFEPEDETIKWHTQNLGEPLSLRDLIDDMEWYRGELHSLWHKLAHSLKETNQ